MISPNHLARFKRARLYARFSPRPDADECESCQHQLEGLRIEAAKIELPVAAEYHDDALSGADHEREQFWLCIRELKRDELLMVRDVRRIARDAMFALTIDAKIRRKGAAIYSIQDGGLLPDDPLHRMVRGILHHLAEYDRHTRNDQTSAGMRRNQKNGRRMSSREKTPYGTKAGPEKTVGHDKQGRPIIEKPLLPDEAELQAIETMIKPWHLAGLGLREIARRLADEGIDCRGHAHWNHGTIRAILVREGLLPPLERRSQRKASNGV